MLARLSLLIPFWTLSVRFRRVVRYPTGNIAAGYLGVENGAHPLVWIAVRLAFRCDSSRLWYNVLHESALHRRDRDHQHRLYRSRHLSAVSSSRCLIAGRSGASALIPAGARIRRCRYRRLRRRLPRPSWRVLRCRRRLDRLRTAPTSNVPPRTLSRPHSPVRLHQFCQRLPETRRALPHHRIDAPRQSLLDLLPAKNRLRRPADARLHCHRKASPVTIVRPSLTYGESRSPSPLIVGLVRTRSSTACGARPEGHHPGDDLYSGHHP